MIFIAYLVLFLSYLNLLRLALFLIGSDIYDIKKGLDGKSERSVGQKKRNHYPIVSVLVPAHNEEAVLRRNLDSVYANTYKNIELIIINDSSTDKTYSIARYFQQRFKTRFSKIKVLNVNVRGKASALNIGLRYAEGSLFMCLDADSTLDSKSIEIAVKEFSDPKVATIAANVKIMPGKGMLNTFQQIEYLIGQQGKKMENLASIQYIVGGVGSMFRTKLVREAGLYDTDTITEDIDLSVKLISHHGTKYRIGYSPDIITYTESVTSVPDLLRQRFRWKYGRYQVFLKFRHLFFSRDIKHNKLLSWVYLPYALVSEFLYTLEPLVFILIVTLLVQYGDATIIAGSFIVFSFYTIMQITAATGGYTQLDRIRLVALAPAAYIGMYVLSFVEYTATIRGYKNLYRIYKNLKNGSGTSAWKHVKRSGHAVIT